MDKEPTYHMQINGEAFDATRKNLTLFTFMGRSVMEGLEIDNPKFDHVFVTYSETETEFNGVYVFKEAQETFYGRLVKFITKHNCPQFLNRLDVPQCDIDAWNSKMFGDLNKIPEEWLDGTA